MENWPGSATILAVRCKGTRDGKPVDETRYYGSSLRSEAKTQLQHVRDGWSYCFAEALRLRELLAQAPRHPASGERASLPGEQRLADHGHAPQPGHGCTMARCLVVDQ